MNRDMTCGLTYPFEWLDETIEITLNPKKNSVTELAPDELRLINERFDIETRQIIARLKEETFLLRTAEQIGVVAGQYMQATHILVVQARINMASYGDDSLLLQTGQYMISSLTEMSELLLKRYSAYLPKQQAVHLSEDLSGESFKVLCKLSADQLAILIKALDDAHVIVAKSASMIFRSVVPFLSTERKEHLSWASLRSSSYRAEATDKAAAIDALERMIKKIKEY
ncbi:MAG: hypothetical protein ACHQHN_13795 [Sphingobacteriales bacterium]